MTHQDSNYRVVIGVVDVVRELFYDLEKMSYETVIDVYCTGKDQLRLMS